MIGLNDIFEQVLAEPVAGDPSLVRVTWRSSQQADRLVQVYVDGLWADVTDAASQRELWLVMDRSRVRSVDLLAVPAEHAFDDLSTEVGLPCSPVARLDLVATYDLPTYGWAEVKLNGETVDAGALWSSAVSRGGFGGLFGIGEFGRDHASGPGHGLGDFGFGPWGEDAHAWRWISADLDEAVHVMELNVTTANGQLVAAAEPIERIVSRPPCAADAVWVDSDFTLHWETS